MKQLLSALILSLTISLAMPAGGFASTDVIEARKANFKQSGGAMRQMRGQLQSGDYDAIAISAAEIAAWAEKMPEFFPKDSGPDANRTNAKATIWDQFDSFTALANNNQRAALALAKAAKMGDANAIMSNMQELGKTCGACHSQFKN